MRLQRHIWRGLACGAAALLIGADRADAQLAREIGLPAPDEAPATASPVLPTESGFALAQLRYPRVRDARVATRFNIKRQFEQRGIAYPAAEMFIRIFKRERTLEVWVRPENAETFVLLTDYDICALAGELGPKRRQGDNQVPEGFYTVDFFNPQSEYHLSLHVDYPNARDRAVLPRGVNPGGDIYIHGGCSSAGCLAITDDGIKELYWMAVEVRSAGQQRIPVHIFPARLTAYDVAQFERVFVNDPGLVSFWKSLKPGYDYFEQNRRLPAMMVDARGDYVMTGESTNASATVGRLQEAPGPRPAAADADRAPPIGSKVSGGTQ